MTTPALCACGHLRTEHATFSHSSPCNQDACPCYRFLLPRENHPCATCEHPGTIHGAFGCYEDECGCTAYTPAAPTPANEEVTALSLCACGHFHRRDGTDADPESVCWATGCPCYGFTPPGQNGECQCGHPRIEHCHHVGCYHNNHRGCVCGTYRHVRSLPDHDVDLGVRYHVEGVHPPTAVPPVPETPPPTPEPTTRGIVLRDETGTVTTKPPELVTAPPPPAPGLAVGDVFIWMGRRVRLVEVMPAGDGAKDLHVEWISRAERPRLAALAGETLYTADHEPVCVVTGVSIHYPRNEPSEVRIDVEPLPDLL